MDQPFLFLYIYFFLILWGLGVLYNFLCFPGGGCLSFNGAFTFSTFFYRQFLAAASPVLFIVSTPRFYGVAFNVDKVPADFLLSSNLLFGLVLIYRWAYLHGPSLPVKSWAINFVSIFFSLFLVFGQSFLHFNTFWYSFRSIEYLVFQSFLFLGFFYYLQIIFSYSYSVLYTKSKCLQNQPLCFDFLFGFVTVALIFFAWSVFFFYSGSVSWVPPRDLLDHFRVVLTIFIMGGSIMYLKSLNTSNTLLFVLVGIYCFVPAYPYLGATSPPSLLYGAILLVYMMIMHRLLFIPPTSSFSERILLLALIFTGLIFSLVGSRGGFIFLVSFMLFAVYYFKYPRSLLYGLLCIFVSGVFYLFCLVPPGAKLGETLIERFPLPLQQTARYVKYSSNTITESEKSQIWSALPFDDISSAYDPRSVRPILDLYNSVGSGKNINEYLIAWLVGFGREPVTYLEGSFNTFFLYLYPLHFVPLPPSDISGVAMSIAESFRYLPLLGLLSNGAFIFWMYILLGIYAICARSLNHLVLLSPILVLIVSLFGAGTNPELKDFAFALITFPIMFILFTFNLRKLKNPSFFITQTNNYTQIYE